MCLAIPGRVLQVEGEAPELRTGAVDFAGVSRHISLAFTPDVRPGQYVLVHAGFALSVVDEEEAQRIFETLRELDQATNPEAP
jgi:hydrogenase expression/formation protein HypC